MANTRPSLTGLAPLVTFGENAVNAAPALIDDNVAFVDPDNNFAGGTLQVSGLRPEDRVAIRNQGFGSGEIGLFGVNVTYGGIAIGTFSGGVGGTLTVSFTSAATSVAIDALIQNLTYANVSNTPSPSRTLSIAVIDDAAAGVSANIVVNVTPEPDVPVLTGVAGSVTVFENSVNASPAIIDGDVGFLIGSANLGGGRLTVSGLLAEDRVGIRNEGTSAGQIGVSGGTVTYGGTAIGTVSGGAGGTLYVSLTAAANQAAVDALIQNLTYANASDTPTATRTLHIGLLDGAGLALNAAAISVTERTGAANPFNGIDVGAFSTPSFADLDGDGDLDLVAGETGGTLRTFFNAGGAFVARTGAANPFNGVDVGYFSAPSFADLDGDGDLDLVVGSREGTLRTFFNTGGTFSERTGAANPFNGIDVGSESGPSLADLDGDGDLDLVAGETGGTLRTFFNTGGAFSERTGAANPFDGIDVGLYSKPSFADLDGDGDLDLMVGGTDGKLRTFFNTGGAFSERTGAANPVNGIDIGDLSAPGFADIDGDGDLDLVIGQSSGMLQAYLNTSSSGADIVVTVRAEKEPPTLTGLAPAVTFAENAVNAAPALLDGDVVFATDTGGFGGGRLTVSGLLAEDRVGIRSEGTGAGQIGVSGASVTYGGTVIGTVTGGVGGTLSVSLTAAASGAALDALIQNLTYANVSNTPTATRTLHIGLLDGAGTPLNPAPAVFEARTGAANPFTGVDVGFLASPSAIDLDGDGDLDVVVGNSAGGALRSFRNVNGAYVELVGAANPFNGFAFGGEAMPSFVDLDGDGDLDAVVGIKDGTLRSFRNTGGVFTELTGAANPFQGLDVGIYAASGFVDLDGDGDLDAVIGSYDNIRSFRNDGGRFTELLGASNPLDISLPDNRAKPSFIDLDGDGDLDAVIGGYYGAPRAFRNIGGGFVELTGSANPFANLTTGDGVAATFVDLDGDGDLDALIGERFGTIRAFTNITANGASVVVTVTPEAEVPMLTGIAASVSFAENAVNAAPAVIDGAVAFTAGSAGLGGGRLTVSGLLAEDRVAVRNEGTAAGQVGVSGSTVTFGGVAIGTLSGGVGGTLSVALNAAATQIAVDALIQNLTYANVSDTPTAARTLHVGLVDGQGYALNPASANVYTAATGAANPLGGVVGEYQSPAFVDLDGDGDLDLLVGNYGSGLRAYRNDGGSFVGIANPLPGDFTAFRQGATFGDYDGDGDVDAVVGDVSGQLRTFRRDGGSFTELTGGANPLAGIDVGLFSRPAFGDLDGDLDLLVGAQNGAIRAFRNTGGSFTELTGANNPFGALGFGQYASPSFVDLDGDGDMDVVVGGGNGLRAFRNTNGTFAELTGAANPLAGVAVRSGAAGFADIDGDGDLDAVVGGSNGVLQTFVNSSSSGADIIVTVSAEPDGPRLSGVATSVSFAENAVNATPAAIDGEVTFTADLGLTGGTLAVSGLLAEDRVGVRNQGAGAGQIGVSGVNVTYGGVAIGTASGGVGASLIVTFNSDASAAAVDALIQNLTYANVSNTPTPTRTLTIAVAGSGGSGSASAQVLVGVTPEADVSVAAADTASVAENTTATIAVLGNDTAGDSALAVATIAGQAVSSGGSVRLASGALVTLNANGTLGYNPNGAYDYLVSAQTAAATGAVNSTALDTFSYGLANGGTAGVSVTVTGVAGAGDRLAGDGSRNFLSGTSGNDVFLLMQGGDDAAFGGEGNDQFLFGRELTAADRVDGGAGNDAVALQGSYALTLGAGSLVNVEALTLLSGSDVRFGDLANNRYSYTLATVDENVAAGRELLVNASSLLAGEGFSFDGSAERDGSFFIYGGAGRDLVTGGAGNDRLLMVDGRFAAGDTFDGGMGNDALVLRGDYAGANAVMFQAGTIINVEALTLLSAFDTRFGALGANYSYTVTMHDANVAAGGLLIVNGSTMRSNEVLRFNGAAETDGSYRILAGAGNDVLMGSRGADTVLGGLGADDMTGGLGADTFRYDSAADSTVQAMDLIRGFVRGEDRIDLARIDANANIAGNDAFTFIDSRAFSRTAGELRSFVDQQTGRVMIEGDVNGDGTADLTIAFDTTLAQPLQASDFIL